MKRTILLTFIIICMTSPLHAADCWDKTDIGLGITATALLMADLGQTHCIADNPQQFRERNPIMGSHPSRGKVDAYFAGSAIGLLAVAHFLPLKWRKVWLTGWIILEAGTVIANQSIGIGIRF